MSLQQQIIGIAAFEVGVHESGGNNCGPEIVKYQKATTLSPGAWPWCAAFCAWVLMHALATDEGRSFCVDHGMLVAEHWRCKSARAFDWQIWAAKSGQTVLPGSALAKAGDFLIFDFNGSAAGGGHIGIVEFDQVLGQPIRTIEGNTNDAGDRDSIRGDGVLRKLRHNALVKCFVRLN